MQIFLCLSRNSSLKSHFKERSVISSKWDTLSLIKISQIEETKPLRKFSLSLFPVPHQETRIGTKQLEDAFLQSELNTKWEAQKKEKNVFTVSLYCESFPERTTNKSHYSNNGK